MTSNAKPAEVLVIDYADLLDDTKDLTAQIKEAFGYDGLGILAVINIPEYDEKRQQLLPLAYKFANLPEEIKAKYEHEESYYSFGWSHGKEKFEGKPDFSKGSYYANPIHDEPSQDAELIKKYPAFLHPNIWPKEDLPELEGAFKDLGGLVTKVGALIARQCDALVKQEIDSYSPSLLTNTVQNCKTHKGRLLYYFPVDKEVANDGKTTEFSSWCGWHNDHGSLTGLVNNMFFDKEGNEIPCPDPEAGLYIKSRNGDIFHVKLPKGAMGFQIGESAQIHSGGVLQATPHSVRAAKNEGVGRATLAVFMEPEWHESMSVPTGSHLDRVVRGAQGELLPPGVPALATRWTNGDDFGTFTEKTLQSYY